MPTPALHHLAERLPRTELWAELQRQLFEGPLLEPQQQQRLLDQLHSWPPIQLQAHLTRYDVPPNFMLAYPLVYSFPRTWSLPEETPHEQLQRFELWARCLRHLHIFLQEADFETPQQPTSPLNRPLSFWASLPFDNLQLLEIELITPISTDGWETICTQLAPRAPVISMQHSMPDALPTPIQNYLDDPTLPAPLTRALCRLRYKYDVNGEFSKPPRTTARPGVEVASASVGELRALLHQPPSIEGFQQALLLLTRTPTEEQRALLELAQRYLGQWPSNLRSLHLSHWDAQRLPADVTPAARLLNTLAEDTPDPQLTRPLELLHHLSMPGERLAALGPHFAPGWQLRSLHLDQGAHGPLHEVLRHCASLEHLQRLQLSAQRIPAEQPTPPTRRELPSLRQLELSYYKAEPESIAWFLKQLHCAPLEEVSLRLPLDEAAIIALRKTGAACMDLKGAHLLTSPALLDALQDLLDSTSTHHLQLPHLEPADTLALLETLPSRPQLHLELCGCLQSATLEPYRDKLGAIEQRDDCHANDIPF